MNAIKFLRLAHKADQLGNYKLADKFFNQAYRFAAGERAIEEAVIKALERAGIKSGEAITTEALVAAVDKAIAEAVAGGDKSALEALLREAGAAEDDVAAVVEKVAVEGAAALEKDALILKLSESLNSPEGIARRMKIGVPPTKPGFVDKVKEISGNIGQKLSSWYTKDPKKAKRILTLAGITIAGSAVTGFFLLRGGKKISDEETNRIIDEAQNDPYKNMYQDRIDANQQQSQNDAAQKFVDENKGKFKTQRAFYDAALGAGDRNFANDVIAIVKRDLTMDIGPRTNNNF